MTPRMFQDEVERTFWQQVYLEALDKDQDHETATVRADQATEALNDRTDWRESDEEVST